MTHRRVLSIGPDHPSLPGHFPGHPVVPGVVMMEEVIETLRDCLGRDLVITGLPAVKLSSPLRPGETVTVDIEPESDDTAGFICRVEDRPVAAGTVRFRRAAPARTRPS
jgi:3-hydroxymyristoyl/3-hydroxydecanoyl-(acyl carrier protein) dehydratase